MKHMILAACVAMLGAAAAPAGAHAPQPGASPGAAEHPETITPLLRHTLPNVPGKDLIAVEVTFPPGAASPPHRHPKSAFVYAYVLSGEIVSAVDDEKPRVYRAGDSWYEAPGAHHPVTRNDSQDKPAKLLVVFIADPGEQKLVFPDRQ